MAILGGNCRFSEIELKRGREDTWKEMYAEKYILAVIRAEEKEARSFRWREGCEDSRGK